jgi:hypothetical protein
MRWRVVPGDFEVMVATPSEDLPFNGTLKVTSSSPCVETSAVGTGAYGFFAPGWNLVEGQDNRSDQ